MANIFGTTGPTPSYEVVQLGYDRRLLLNRKRKLQMWRVWLVRLLGLQRRYSQLPRGLRLLC